ncbi:unnamed protein product [Ectocarpus sp. CCAP 1310/34]|nr:unnamed protein product [Ectocarpus sp. CCAP 1310/34]
MVVHVGQKASPPTEKGVGGASRRDSRHRSSDNCTSQRQTRHPSTAIMTDPAWPHWPHRCR